ncbi:hypothetical protein BSKO_11561 [Bryopsis sp. KO-2023]|nr:hypothetical protein BSKO_11561 [Bryopsis sp. KO-2023]
MALTRLLTSFGVPEVQRATCVVHPAALARFDTTSAVASPQLSDPVVDATTEVSPPEAVAQTANPPGPKRKRKFNRKSKAAEPKDAKSDQVASTSPNGSGQHKKPSWKYKSRTQENVFHKGTWLNLSRLHYENSHHWKTHEAHQAWRRSVNAHLEFSTHNLFPTAACFSHQGRHFLTSLKKTTLRLAEKEPLAPTVARDIGWAAGKQYWLDKELSGVVCDGLIKDGDIKSTEVPLQEIVPVIWGMANSGQYPEKLFDMIIGKKAEIMDKFNVQNCTNVLWAMAVCGYHPGNDFLSWMSEYTASLFEKAPNSAIPQAVSDFLWSLGRFSYEPEPLKVVHKVLAWAYDRLPAFEIGEITGTALGLAMCKVLTSEDMRKLGESFRERSIKTGMAMDSLHADRMFTLTLLFPAEERLRFQQMCFGPNLEKATEARQERQSQIAVQMRGNHFLQRVGRHLEKAGASYKIGVISVDRNLAFELLVTEGEETYALIPVFPMSKNRNDGSVLLGETILARQLIERQGLRFGGVLEWSSGVTKTEEQQNSTPESSDDAGTDIEVNEANAEQKTEQGAHA